MNKFKNDVCTSLKIVGTSRRISDSFGWWICWTSHLQESYVRRTAKALCLLLLDKEVISEEALWRTYVQYSTVWYLVGDLKAVTIFLLCPHLHLDYLG